MQVVILNAGSGWHTDDLCRALAERGHTGRVLPYDRLVARLGTGRGVVRGLSNGSNEILDADAVLARIIPSGSLEQTIYRVDALHWIERRGVPVLNPARAIERSVDKFYTTALLQEAGLPTPETVVCESAADAMSAVLAMGDVVIKPIFGSMGHGIVRVNDPDVAFRAVRALEQLRTVFYVQRAVDHGGKDVRVFVVGGRVVGAIERQAPEGHWRTNVSLGGAARPLDLPLAWERLALDAAAAITRRSCARRVIPGAPRRDRTPLAPARVRQDGRRSRRPRRSRLPASARASRECR